MKAINRFIIEKLKITNKPEYTLRNFIEWYINEEPGCELTVHNVRYLDFNRSPSETWSMFDGSSTNIAKFLLKHLDDKIELTEDVNKEEKEITYTFYIDDILFIVCSVYNTRTKYPTFFDQYVNESLVTEKLRISNKTYGKVDWEEFLKVLTEAVKINKKNNSSNKIFLTQLDSFKNFKISNLPDTSRDMFLKDGRFVSIRDAANGGIFIGVFFEHTKETITLILTKENFLNLFSEEILYQIYDDLKNGNFE